MPILSSLFVDTSGILFVFASANFFKTEKFYILFNKFIKYKVYGSLQSRIAGKDQSSRRHCKKTWEGDEKLGKNNESFFDNLYHRTRFIKKRRLKAGLFEETIALYDKVTY